MSIKLIAIDIDGTLLNDQHQVTSEVKAALDEAQARGIKIVLCTGRPIIGVLPLVEELGLDKQDDFVISYNGSIIQDAHTKEKISLHGLTHEDFLDIEMTARRLDVHLHTETEEHIYTANRDISPYTVHEAYLVNMPIRYRTPEEMTPDLSIIKMMMIDDPEKLARVEQELPDFMRERFTVVKSTPFFLEILNKNVNKGAAVHQLATHLGLTSDEVMAIGDNENDLEMIQYAGTGVAMGNATENVKNHATVITKTNNEHGVAHAIRTYALV